VVNLLTFGPLDFPQQNSTEIAWNLRGWADRLNL